LYTSLDVILNHARGVTGFGGGSAVRLSKRGELDVLTSQGLPSTLALRAFRPGHGRLAAVWSTNSTEPSASVAMLSDVGSDRRVSLAYALLPVRNMPLVLLLLVRS